MRAKVFYPPCRWLDPDTRDAEGRFFFERRCCFVAPGSSVYRRWRVDRHGHLHGELFVREACAPDCWHRRGQTRIPKL